MLLVNSVAPRGLREGRDHWRVRLGIVRIWVLNWAFKEGGL